MDVYMSFDNGANWVTRKFNVFGLQDGQLYVGENDIVYKVTRTADGKINSTPYTDFVNAPPQ